jgi:CsoR family transcriptional regulator, copper-sensing transcriptional repressor
VRPDRALALGLLDDHARHRVLGGNGEGGPEELTDELMAAVARLMRRG